MSSTTSVQRSSLSGANWRKPLAPRNAGVVYALVLLVAILTFTCSVQGRPSYLSSVNVTNILDQSALIATLAIFMTVVLITGNFDLSVASTAALAGTIALKLIDGYGVAVAVLVALAVGGLVPASGLGVPSSSATPHGSAVQPDAAAGAGGATAAARN